VIRFKSSVIKKIVITPQSPPYGHVVVRVYPTAAGWNGVFQNPNNAQEVLNEYANHVPSTLTGPSEMLQLQCHLGGIAQVDIDIHNVLAPPPKASIDIEMERPLPPSNAFFGSGLASEELAQCNPGNG
jgi:hypothetical protein